jgi:hypothetical protein
MFFQDSLTGSAWGDWALFTASPRRTFENELDMQAPGGLWDPAASPRVAAPRTLRAAARRRSSAAASPGLLPWVTSPGDQGPVPRHSGCHGRLRLLGSDLLGPKRVFEEVENGRVAIKTIIAYMAFGVTLQNQSPGTLDATGDFGS